MTARASAKSTRGAATPRVDAAAPFAPMSFTTLDPKTKQDRLPLFEIDGVEYTVPAVVPTGHSLKLMLNTSGMNEGQRGAYLIEALVGNAGLNALLNADLSDADWHRLITTLSKHVFGRLEEPGN